jgi:tetratricopeptide (TPR) repeat protein
MLLAASIGGWWWFRPLPGPPVFRLDEHEPEVAAAIEQARQAVVHKPAAAAAWGQLAEVLLANHVFPEEALVCLAQAEKREPDNPRWPYLRAKTLVELQRLPEARVPAEKAVQLSPDRDGSNPAPRLLLAEILLGSGQLEQAESQFHKALEQAPKHAQAHWGLGRLALARQDWPACKRNLEACLANPEVRKRAAVQLAAVCQRLGDDKSAARFAQLAARWPEDRDWIDPFTEDYLFLSRRKADLYNLASALEARGRYDDAVRILESLADKHPLDHTPHLELGKLLSKMKKYGAAEEHLCKALQGAVEKLHVNYFLSVLYLQVGIEEQHNQPPNSARAQHSFQNAERCARQALLEKPDFGFAHAALGLALQKLERPGEALAAFRQAVHCLPEQAENHLALGKALAEAGKTAEARHHLEEARALAGANDPGLTTAIEKLIEQVGPATAE